MYGEPRPGATSPAAEAAWQILRGHVRRLAQAGRLRLAEEQAARLITPLAAAPCSPCWPCRKVRVT